MPSAGMGEQKLSPVLRNQDSLGVSRAGRGAWQTGVWKERSMVLSGVIDCLWVWVISLCSDTAQMNSGDAGHLDSVELCPVVGGVGRKGAVCAQAQC